MRLISHRGNVDGKYPQYENLPSMLIRVTVRL